MAPEPGVDRMMRSISHRSQEINQLSRTTSNCEDAIWHKKAAYVRMRNKPLKEKINTLNLKLSCFFRTAAILDSEPRAAEQLQVFLFWLQVQRERTTAIKLQRNKYLCWCRTPEPATPPIRNGLIRTKSTCSFL